MPIMNFGVSQAIPSFGFGYNCLSTFSMFPSFFGLFNPFQSIMPNSGYNCLNQSTTSPSIFGTYNSLQPTTPSINNNIWGSLGWQPSYSTPAINTYMPAMNFTPNPILQNLNSFNMFSNSNIKLNNSKVQQTTSTNLTKTETLKGTEVKDGTPITVAGINYSIFGSSASRIKQLRPEMQKRMELLYKYCKQKGWKISLTSAFRSTEKQKQLYALKLAGKKKCAVAKPGTSRHEFGCAVDISVTGPGGSKLRELTSYATSIGLRQGLSFNEPWHFDMNPKTTPKGRISQA